MSFVSLDRNREREVESLLSEAGKRDFTHEEAVFLLESPNFSEAYYRILCKAQELTRREYGNRAYIFSQIGLNAAPCSGNCRFCSMAAGHYAVDREFQKTTADLPQIRETVLHLVNGGTHDIFLMTTADYPMTEFLAIGRAVRAILPDGIRLVANIGDFDEVTAHELIRAGFTGVYHICRLREGIDTDLSPEMRLSTIRHALDAGLELYYCIEPIGPEHTYAEIADEMIRARDFGTKAMAVMRRTSVAGTPFEDKGVISSAELTKIAAVTRIVSRPSRSMNVHEVTPMSLLAGVNQLYAEAGANPRDRIHDTARGRGYSVEAVTALLRDAEYVLA